MLVLIRKKFKVSLMVLIILIVIMVCSVKIFIIDKGKVLLIGLEWFGKLGLKFFIFNNWDWDLINNNKYELRWMFE